MDSDLQLIEISGEDDSLLLQISTSNDVSPVNDNNNFSVSPLHIPPSKSSIGSQGMNNDMDPKRPSSSPICSNKENMNFNKSDAQKLSLEPLQMKRKKRGYNLRKSLAWDRAFFTEEGVLDPLELSMISGTSAYPCGEALSVISEEGKSERGGFNSTTAAVNLQAFEENLFTGLSCSPLCESRTKPASSLLQHNSLSHDKLAPKSVEVHSTGSRIRTGFKGERCPRPLASSSLKRPANVQTVKSAMKDSKLPKLPSQKPGPHSLHTTKSSIMKARNLKYNQIAQPVNVQKNVSLESSSKNGKNAPSKANKARSGPSCLPLPPKVSARHTRGNMAESSGEVPSFINPQPLPVREPYRNSEAIPDPLVPVLSSKVHYGSNVTAGSLAPSTIITGGNKSQIQKAKPSGLRMPSPSLGYFGQRSTELGKIPELTVHGLQKSVFESGDPHATKKISKKNDITAKPKATGLRSSMQCSELNTSNAAAPKTVESYLKVDNVQKVELPVPFVKSSEPKCCKHKEDDATSTVENIVTHVTNNQTEETAYQMDANLQIINNQRLLENGTCKQLRQDNHDRSDFTDIQFLLEDMKNSQCMPKNVCEMDAINACKNEGTIEHHNGGKESENHSVTNHGATSELQPAVFISYEKHHSISENNDQKDSCLQERAHRSMDQPESVKHFICDDNQNSYVGSNSPKSSGGVSELLSEVSKDTIRNMETFDLNAPSCGGVEWKGVVVPILHEQLEQEHEAVTVVSNVSDTSDATDAQLTQHNNISYAKNSESNLSSSKEHLEVQSPLPGVEQNFQINSESKFEESYGKEVGESVQCTMPERSGVRKSETNVQNDISTPLPSHFEDGQSDINGAEEKHSSESKFGFAERGSSVEIQECSSEHTGHAIELTGNMSSLKVGTSFLTQFSESLLHNYQASPNDIERDAQNIRVHALTNYSVMEGAEAEAFLKSPGKSKAVEETQNLYIVKDSEASSIIHACSGSEENSQYLHHYKDIEKTLEDAGGVGVLTRKLHVKDSQLKHIKVIENTEKFVKEVDESSSCILEKQQNDFNLCSEVDEEFKDNRHLFSQDPCSAEESKQGCVLESVANVHPMNCGNEYKNGNQPSGEDAQSDSVGIKSSSGHQEHFSDKQFRQDIQHSGYPTSLESDSSLKLCIDSTEGVTTIGTGCCSFSDTLEVKGVQNSSGSSQVGARDMPKRINSDEFETTSAQDVSNPVGEWSNGLDNSKASRKDKDVTALITEPENKMGPDSCMILPLPDSVQHFEDNNQVCPCKIIDSREHRKESYSESDADVLSRHSYVCGRDLDNSFHVEKKDGMPYGEDEISDSVGNESLVKHHQNFIHKHLIQDVEHVGQVISLESYSDLKISEDCSESMVNICPEPCSLGDELVGKELLTSSRRSSEVGLSNGLKSIFTDQNDPDDYNIACKMHSKLETVKDEDANASVNQTEIGMRLDNSLIISPPNAIHHSEDSHFIFAEKISTSMEWQQESVLKCAANVHSEQSYACGGNHGRNFDEEKMQDRPYGGEDVPSGSIWTKSSADVLDHFTDRKFRKDLNCSGQAISLEYDTASSICQDWSKDVRSKSFKSCLFGEESAGVQTSSRCVLLGKEESLVRTFSDEIETEKAQDCGSPSDKLHNEPENVKSSVKDKDATTSAKQRRTIIPPPDAVPFSEEWLVAMEAAGEDILTMKSGAVQNSPHKSLPEPSPWSPVRKNNEIGPFDCTKLTKCNNIQPADL